MTSSIKAISSRSIGVIIVCADWCSVCRDYRVTMSDFSEFDIHWMDIDDFESLTDSLDIETFPTVIIYDEQDIFFLGAVEPNKNSLMGLMTAVSANPPKTDFPNLAKAIKVWLGDKLQIKSIY